MPETENNNSPLLGGYIRCLRCNNRLESTGSPDRLECPECGQNYRVLIQIQLIPIEGRSRNLLSESTVVK
jgi:DNA-directed RNA polymerase subunit RPC12/RpoP